jgi:hypothetical protein
MALVNIQDKFIVRTTAGGGAPAPSTPTITNKTSSGFTVSWNSVAGAIGYKLDVSTDSSFSSFVTGYDSKDVAGTTQVVTGLSQNTTYYVRVRAVSASANSGSASDTTEVMTLLNPGLQSGLLAFYKLDDLTDASGNGNTLTNDNGVTFTSGKIGNAATFNNTNKLLSPVSVPFGSAATISVWAKPTTLDNSYGTIVGYFPGLNVAISNSNTITVDDFTQPFIWGPSVSIDTWYHIVVKVENSVCYVYVNGSLVTSQNSILQTGNVLKIGAEANDYFTGQIDAIGVWNRALTDSEIAELYNSGSGLE